MLYNYIKEYYKEAEPNFFSDLLCEDITDSTLNHQLKEFCEKGLLQKYDEEVYFIPKRSKLNREDARTPSLSKINKTLRNLLLSAEC